MRTLAKTTGERSRQFLSVVNALLTKATYPHSSSRVQPVIYFIHDE
jgi:hypothetical protein